MPSQRRRHSTFVTTNKMTTAALGALVTFSSRHRPFLAQAAFLASSSSSSSSLSLLSPPSSSASSSSCAWNRSTNVVARTIILSNHPRTSHGTALRWNTNKSRIYNTSPTDTSDAIGDLDQQITDKGNEIRALKSAGADKSVIDPLVQELLALKDLKNPKPAVASSASSSSSSSKGGKKKTKTDSTEAAAAASEEQSDYITPRSENYSKWYNDIIRVTGLAETSPVRGCMVIKPWGMSLWETVRDDLDKRIKEHGAENAYFPLLIPKSFLSKEAEHVDGFAKECAVVTHHRLTVDPSGEKGLIADPEAELEDPLIIRPTSETMIWNMFKKWIVSHRDLPLKVNQWANVMRWELRTRPFLRTSEFLWQEGHTAHATREGAVEDAVAMIHNYADLCKDLLAIPVIMGCKSPSERFAGAEETYTIEALMQNGWALQSGTSHFLGQSFGKAFDVTFQDKNGKESDVWGTSWGVSTRLLGALIMTHSDDAGLVLPPKVAPVQVVIVPIQPKKNDVEGKAAMDAALDTLSEELKAAGLRVKVDDRDYVRNGAKYFEYERKGVPLRIELGPRDLAKGECVFKYRVGDEGKTSVKLDEAVATAISGLEDMQQKLYDSAYQRLQKGINTGVTYQEMKEALEGDEAGEFDGAGLYLVPWKCNAENEEKIKEECKATIRCYPFEYNGEGAVDGKTCFYTGEPATHMALFGRAF